MYKAGKTWLFAGIGAITLASTVALTSPEAHADEVQADTSSLAVKTATNKQENIDDAQANVDQDVKDINDNKTATTDEQVNHDNLSGQTDSKQDAANQAKDDATAAQNDADKANDQVSDDKNNVDNLTPGDDYKTAEDNADKAQADVNKDQKAANDAKDDVDEANHSVDDATKANDTAKCKADAAKNAKDDAQNKADDAKNTLDNTDKTKKVHHNGKEPKPGTIKNGTEINSEEDLPTHLVKPSDADQYNSYDKQTAAGMNQHSYWDYVGANDTSEKIKNGTLTAAQQKEAAQYALTLINDFRRQHGLKPMKMSEWSLQMAQYDAEMRAKYGVPSGDHSYPGSDADWNGVSQAEWNEAILKRLYPSFSGDLSKAYLHADQDLGMTDTFSASTMLALKVEILKTIQNMAFADMEWDIGDGMGLHTKSLLQDSDGDLWFSFNMTSADEYSISAMLFDIFGTYDNEIGKQLNHDFNANPISEMKSGYDTIEANPDYTKALNDYNAAASALKDANANYTKAIANANNTAAGVKQAKSNLANAQTKLADAKQALTDAQAKLAQAQDTLAQMQAKYADQVKAYEAAKDQLAKDQKAADTANAKLADATKALNAANTALKANKDAIAKSQAHLDQLADELNALQAKLVADEVSLAAAKVAPDDVTPDDNNDAKDNGNDTPTNNDDGKDTPTNNSDKNNATTDDVPTDKTNNDNADHTAANQVTPSGSTSTDNVVNLDTKTNNHVVTPLTTHATTVKNNVNIADTNTTTLPQTGERNQHAEMAMGWIGLIISSLGLAGITRRKRS